MTIGLIERIFNSTEVAETQHGKDVCDFNPIEVVDFLKGLDSKSRRRLQSTCIRLSKYYEWCKNVEHLTNNIVNPFDSRGIDIVIDGILPKEDLNKKYFTKIQYLEMLNEIADPSNKFIAHAFYSGLSLEELVSLKIVDLDFENYIVHLLNGRDLKVDTMFKHLMIEANDQTQYFADGIEVEDVRKRYTYGQSDYIIKKCGVKECDAVRP
jgi:integrase